MVDAYFQAIITLLSQLHKSQKDNIKQVAALAANVMAAGGRLHLLDNGHFLRDELICRAGGLGALNKLTNCNEVNNIALVRKGDLLFIGSVSGRSADIVEVALTARKRGITTVGITSLSQASHAIPVHSSGQLLKDVVDHVIDIGGVLGDAILEVPGLNSRICPSSGISAAVLMWAVIAETVGILVEQNNPPTILTSVNTPGGEAAYEQEVAYLKVHGF